MLRPEISLLLPLVLRRLASSTTRSQPTKWTCPPSKSIQFVVLALLALPVYVLVVLAPLRSIVPTVTGVEPLITTSLFALYSQLPRLRSLRLPQQPLRRPRLKTLLGLHLLRLPLC